MGRIVKLILTTDSRSDKGDSEDVESTTTNTGRKRRRTAGNMAAVHDVRIAVRCASSYSRTLPF